MNIEEKEQAYAELYKHSIKQVELATDPTMDQIFQKVMVKLKQDTLTERENGSLDRFLKDLVTYSDVYYSQILTNLGMEFKINVFNTIMSSGELYTYNESILDIWERKVAKVLSMPLMELYMGLSSSEEMRSLLMLSVKIYIKGLLASIASSLAYLCKIIFNDRELAVDDALFYYESYFKEEIEIKLSLLVDEIVATVIKKDVHGDDAPWTEDEVNVVDFLSIMAVVFHNINVDPIGVMIEQEMKRRKNGIQGSNY